jgi:hypothetical protein
LIRAHFSISLLTAGIGVGPDSIRFQ